jgi:hypothetical protein
MTGNITKQNGVFNQQEIPPVNPPIVMQIPTFSPPTTLPPLVPTAANVPQQDTTQSRDPSSLESQLVEAKAQIAALTKQLEVTSGSGLRQRNAPAAPSSAVTAARPTSNDAPRPGSAREVIQHPVEQGVPVKIVAYLCFAAFLLAYLFFQNSHSCYKMRGNSE